MRKKVNVYPTVPVLNLRTPIYNTALNVDLSVGDIAACIYGRALVDEVLDDGSTVRLSLSNYNKDNRKVVEEKNVEPPKVEEPPKEHNQEAIEQPQGEQEKVEDIQVTEVVEQKVEEQQVQNYQRNKSRNK